MNATRIYLNDHDGLFKAELELIGRVRQENADLPAAEFLAGYELEVQGQARSLRELMQMLGCEASRMKQAAGWLAEKAGRFKLNDALLSYTSLARLLESEALLMSATARQAFWQTVTHRPDLFPFEESALSDLNRQTMRHLAQLRRFHEQTAGMLEI